MQAQPDPLVVNQLLYHNAHTNGNWKIEPTEFSRVITLYNARYTLPDGSGRIRTGYYVVAAPGRPPTATRPIRHMRLSGPSPAERISAGFR